MIRKLAEELTTNTLVTGTNDIRPLDPPAAPAAKPSASVMAEHGGTGTAEETNNQDQAGVLSRALSGYDQGVNDYNGALADALGDHVKKLTGSVTLSRSAVGRHKKATGE